MEPSGLAALYNAAPIILWVEDQLTVDYLQALWQHDGRFQLYVGGGHEALSAVVRQARQSGRSRVYCLRDRDFGPTNRDRWKSPDVHAFALETFEIECFLLDPPSLARCSVNTSGHDEAWIRQFLLDRAHTLLWWMSCRKVIAGLREARQVAFPPHPKPHIITSRDDAERVLLGNEWITRTIPGLATLIDPRLLRDSLTRAYEHYSASIDNGSWGRHFSGKELLHDVLTRVFTTRRPKGNAALQDLAKSVARQQLQAGRAPPELFELRQAMLER